MKYEIVVARGGSMDNSPWVGIVDTTYGISDVKKGDVVSVKFRDRWITHPVIKSIDDTDGNYIITKGDNNEHGELISEDLDQHKMRGKYIYIIKLGKYFSCF